MLLARTWAKRARRERARAHPETRCKRGRDRAQKIAAARAAAFVRDGPGGVRAQPVAAHFAKRIDALHGEARQILHAFSLSGHQLRGGTAGRAAEAPCGGPNKNDAAIVAPQQTSVKKKRLQHIVVRLH